MNEALLTNIIARLHNAGRATTYSALAEVVGGSAQSLMDGRPRNHLNSWVVSKTNYLPTGYALDQIDGRLLASLQANGVLEESADLQTWLANNP
jgi:hypothetical protein